MYSEDRVLVAVLPRVRDWHIANEAHWYRIPAQRPLRGLEGMLETAVDVEIIAFFSPSRATRAGGIYWYAERRGVELAYRRDLLPHEAGHPRAGQMYYKVALSPLVEKTPPILNPQGRRFAFIRTTWDRFQDATTLAALYSREKFYVSRVFYSLGRGR